MIKSINTAPVGIPDIQQDKTAPFKSPEESGKANEQNLEGANSHHEDRKTSGEKRGTEDTPGKVEEISQEMLNELSQDIESLHSVGLSFSRHETTGRTMVRVMDRETNELIREIPAEKVLDMAAKIEMMVGLIFDQKV